MVKGRPYGFLSSVPRSKNRGLISCAFREAMIAQTSVSPIHLPPMRERKIEWQDDTHNGKPIAIQADGSPSSGNYVLQLVGNF